MQKYLFINYSITLSEKPAPCNMFIFYGFMRMAHLTRLATAAFSGKGSWIKVLVIYWQEQLPPLAAPAGLSLASSLASKAEQLIEKRVNGRAQAGRHTSTASAAQFSSSVAQ